MNRPDHKKPLGSRADAAAKRLACWIVNAHGAQDWKIKTEEASEPVAAALGIPHEPFRKLVTKHVEQSRDTDADNTPPIQRR